jgi:hypothetical protein
VIDVLFILNEVHRYVGTVNQFLTELVVVGASGWDLRTDYRKNPQWHLKF